MNKTPAIRPFVATMPIPRIDESLLGYMDRALQNTMIRNSRQALRMAGLDPDPNLPPNAAKLTEEAVVGLAALFKLDPEEVRRRWYRREHGSSASIAFFGTPIRAQYWESRSRRLSPRALAIDPYYRALWEIRCFGFDPETGEPLLEVCPVCGRRFGWTAMRGPTKCDHCTDSDGYPSTDLRDHPKPVIQFRDPEAIGFVVGLLHPDPQRRRAAMALVPEELAGATNGELFEAVMCMASALRPGASTKLTDAGRPLRAPDFAELSAEMLETAGRALIGGEGGFAALADRMRLSADERTASHGLYKELGPLAAMPLDRHLSPVIRRFANDAIARDLARTRDDGFVRRSVPRLADAQGGAWLTMDALSAELGLRKHALGRLAESGAVETRRADAEQSPVLMKIADVAPLAAVYKDAVTGRMVTALLRVPASAIEDLADRELIQRVERPAAAMLPRRPYYRESSAKAVLIAIRERAVPAAGEGRVKLIAAVRKLGRVAPWAAIVEGIVTGALRIQTEAPFGRDWRHAVSVDQSELESFLEQATRPATAGAQEAWLTRDQAAQMLGTDETAVWAMGRDGILPKRKGQVAMFARADVEAAAKRWIFGQEMSARTAFGNGRERNAWLRSVGIMPEFMLRDGRVSVYSRTQVEAALAVQPPKHDEVERPVRAGARVPADIKRQAVEAVRSGLAAYYVGKRLGIDPKSIIRWAQHFEKTGRIEPAGKLDPYADAIVAMIEADPARSTYALHRKFMEREKTNVAYTCFSSFITELGFVREPTTKRLQRTKAGPC